MSERSSSDADSASIEEVTPEQIVEGSYGPNPDVLPTGTLVGGYELEARIASGGGGVVYAARHRVLGRRVAIKVLRSALVSFPVMLTRFVREATAVNQIGHPNIVDVFEFGEMESGRPYYVMEWLEGMDLATRMRLHPRFSVRETFDIIAPVCKAVHAAHEAGFIHRDIKASNVMVARVKGERCVKLLDFGIAKTFGDDAAEPGLTAPGTTLGTVHYMAPEQIRCDPIDPRVDIYALGVLLFQMLTGRFPYDASDPRGVALLHLQAPVPRPSQIVPLPGVLDAVVMRCLQKHPERRYRTAQNLLDALRSAVGHVPKDVATESRPAIAVYGELSTEGGDDLDDAMIDDMTCALDMLERELGQYDFTFPLRTSTALLAVRLSDDYAELGRERDDVVERVAGLKRSVEERSGRHPRVVLDVALTVSEAFCRMTPAGPEVVGGPVLDVAGWTMHGGKGPA